MTESIQRFLAQCAPFNHLEAAQRQWAEKSMTLAYVSQDNVNQMVPADTPQLYVIKKGLFDLVDGEQRLLERLEPGDLFGFPSLLTHRPITNRLRVIEDGLMLVMQQADFDFLCAQNQLFAAYFRQALNERLLLESGQQRASDWSQKRIADLLDRELVQVGPDVSVAEAAALMSEQKVSSLLVVEQQQLLGMLTDRDLRNRVVARRADMQKPVREFMSSPVISVGSHQLLFDAMQIMTTNNVHHLAVTKGSRPVGVMTVTDLIRQQSSEPLYVVSQIRKATSVSQLSDIAGKVPDTLLQFANRTVDVNRVGDLLASFTDAFNKRLIELYTEQYGPAPCAYVWLCFGSQARQDQSLSSDQDNGLLLDNHATESDKDWFAGLGTFVCDGLDQCGLTLCKGNIMAANPELRLTLNEWCDRFEDWIHEPDKQALMRTNIFFDRRALCGEGRLFEELNLRVADMASGNDIFLANLAANTASEAVPIGLFNRFRTHELADHRDVIDVKKQGVAILNNIVRLYSLAHGITDCATPERIHHLTEQCHINASDGKNWLACWRFLIQIRLEHQLNSGRYDNLIEPDKLDSMQRRQLKTAFKLLKEAQEGVAMHFARGAF